MSLHQIYLLLILAMLIAALIWGKYRYDVVSVSALAACAVFGVVDVPDMWVGFSHPATITVALVLVLSHALTKVGALEFVTVLLKPTLGQPILYLVVLMTLSAVLSMFMNNIAALALLMPVALHSAEQGGYSPSLVLMPLAFASILGGMVTLIGTPPNIIIAMVREETTGQAFSMFDFAPVGGAVAIAGVLFMAIIGYRLLPIRRKAHQASEQEIKSYLFEVKVSENSKWLDSKVQEVEENLNEFDVQLVSLIHRKEHFTIPPKRHHLQTADLLILEGSKEEIDKIVSQFKLQLLSAENARAEVLHDVDVTTLEAVVSPNSSIVGRAVELVKFRQRHNINLLAISREGRARKGRLRKMILKSGDALLLHGEPTDLEEVISRLGLYSLSNAPHSFGQRRHGFTSLLTFFVAILAAVLNVMPLQLGFVLAILMLHFGRILTIRELYEAVDWPVIVLLGAMLPIGQALEQTGLTLLFVDSFSGFFEGLHPAYLIAGLLIVTMLLSDVLNNAATVILMAPIAYQMAQTLGINSDPCFMAVAVGASCAFLTPIGHQNNALIMGPGGYLFKDYWRIGLPLEILIAVIAVPMILYSWPQ